MYGAFLEAVAKIDTTFRDRLEKMGILSPKEKKSRKATIDPLLQALSVEHNCPDCKGTSFIMGPKGGMSQNIKCANKECRAEFCVAPFDGAWLGTPFFAQRTNRTPEMSKSIYGF